MPNPRALHLITREHAPAYEGEASLLAYGIDDFSDATVSHDIRLIIDERPATQFIYITAPELDDAAILEELNNPDGPTYRITEHAGAAPTRRFFRLKPRFDGANIIIERVEFFKDTATTPEPSHELNQMLIDGWLFDLFSRRGGLVHAPEGVHFKKGSKKHTETFLRVANILLDANICSLLAFLSLPHQKLAAPRQILVDTAPLISVAQAMVQIARRHKIWNSNPTIKSFSSYGGLNHERRRSNNDLALISASTSGGLQKELIELGLDKNNVIQLFYLSDSPNGCRGENVVCDLKHYPGHSFGYKSIENHSADDCKLCKKGYALAELEGDQFLFQKRRCNYYDIKKKIQSSSARELLDTLALSKVISVPREPSSRSTYACTFDVQELLKIAQIREKFIRLLRRFRPTPLNIVVLHNISEESARQLIEEANTGGDCAGIKFLTMATLIEQGDCREAGVLVLFGCLDDHAVAREINARLRSVAPKGNVAYLSCLTVSESKSSLADLTMFLQYGERGRDTFLFRSVDEIYLTFNRDGDSPWQDEVNLLRRMDSEERTVGRLRVRLAELEAVHTLRNELFLSRDTVPLRIRNDFVYLNIANVEDVSQSVVFAVISNLLAEVRALAYTISRGGPSQDEVGANSLRNSIYTQGLISPESFRLYNDPILRGALLRAARPVEMMYQLDEETSREIAEIIIFETQEFRVGQGDSLPEFLLALATRRLQLADADLSRIKSIALGYSLPDWIQALLNEITF